MLQANVPIYGYMRLITWLKEKEKKENSGFLLCGLCTFLDLHMRPCEGPPAWCPERSGLGSSRRHDLTRKSRYCQRMERCLEVTAVGHCALISQYSTIKSSRSLVELVCPPLIMTVTSEKMYEANMPNTHHPKSNSLLAP